MDRRYWERKCEEIQKMPARDEKTDEKEESVKRQNVVAHKTAKALVLATALCGLSGAGYSLNPSPATLGHFVPFALPWHSQTRLEGLIQFLSKSPKIITDNSPLSDFSKGATTARVIVILRKPVGASETSELTDFAVRQQVQESVRAANERVIGSLNPDEVRVTNRFVYIFGFSAEVTIQGIKDLIDNADVVSVEKDQIIEAHLAQGIPLMNASAVRNTYNGSGISIAICDTGIDYTHPRLGGGGFPNSKVIGGHDCGDDDNDPMDTYGHGTCCSGIAAGSLGTVGDYIGGVAYNAKLYAVKISYGSWGSAFVSDEIEGWEWCITHQFDDPANPIMIISMSFGGGRYYGTCDTTSPALTTAAANAVAAGITLFVSSGNDGYCDSISKPACISHVISVGAVYDAAFGLRYPCVDGASCAPTKAPSGTCSTGWHATDSTMPDMVTSYSNTASFLVLLAPSNAAYTTDIVGAGGYNLTGDYYNSFGGTSAACPYAAGAAACVQSAAKAMLGSFLTPAQVKSTLIHTGDLIIDGKVAITKPRVNLGYAVDLVAAFTPVPTPTPTPTPIPPLVIDPEPLTAGQPFTLGILLNGNITRPFDFYMFAETPAGIYTIYLSGKVQKGLKALYRNINSYLGPYSKTIRPPVNIPSSMKGKTITFYALVVETGKMPPVKRPSELMPDTLNVIMMDKKMVIVE